MLTGFQLYAGGAPGVVEGTNDLRVSFAGLTSVTDYRYTSTNYPDSVFAASTFEGEATQTPIPSAPIPATVWLLLTAGAGMLRFKRQAAESRA